MSDRRGSVERLMHRYGIAQDAQTMILVAFEAERDQLRADLEASREETRVARMNVASFGADLDAARAQRNDWARIAGKNAGEAEVLKADNARLREALRKYGRHVGCAKSHRGKYRKPADIPASDKLCTCGLDAALAGPGGE